MKFNIFLNFWISDFKKSSANFFEFGQTKIKMIFKRGKYNYFKRISDNETLILNNFTSWSEDFKMVFTTKKRNYINRNKNFIIWIENISVTIYPLNEYFNLETIKGKLS